MDFNKLLDNSDIDKVMEVLENIEDDQLSVRLLKEFNEATKTLGQLLMNNNPLIDNELWKTQCDEAKKEVDKVVAEILSHR